MRWEKTEREAFRIVQPLIEGYTEGIYWDFKKGLTDEHIPDIIKDILAFSNSDYEGDSYIIVGVGESKDETQRKIPLSTDDRRRLNTDAIINKLKKVHHTGPKKIYTRPFLF